MANASRWNLIGIFLNNQLVPASQMPSSLVRYLNLHNFKISTYSLNSLTKDHGADRKKQLLFVVGHFLAWLSCQLIQQLSLAGPNTFNKSDMSNCEQWQIAASRSRVQSWLLTIPCTVDSISINASTG
jgi:hypothetical protein